MSNTAFERTDMEYGDFSHYVRIQHCEHKDEHGVVCNEYLGVNYPSAFCQRHEPK